MLDPTKTKTNLSYPYLRSLPPTRTPVLPETLHLVPRLGVLVARVLVAPVLSPSVVPPRWAVPARVALLRELAFDVPWPPTPQVWQKKQLSLGRLGWSIQKTSPIRMISWQTMMDPIIIYIYIYVQYRFCHDFTIAVWFLFKVFVPKKCP